MTKDEVIKVFIDTGYLVKEGDGYIITNKFKREENPPEKEEPVKLLGKNELFKKFVGESRIPLRAPNGKGGTYMLRQKSQYAVNALWSLIQNRTYKYEDMVFVTHQYYNNTRNNRQILTNYFKNGILEALMEEFLEQKTANVGVPKTVQEVANQTSNKVIL